MPIKLKMPSKDILSLAVVALTFLAITSLVLFKKSRSLHELPRLELANFELSGEIWIHSLGDPKEIISKQIKFLVYQLEPLNIFFNKSDIDFLEIVQLQDSLRFRVNIKLQSSKSLRPDYVFYVPAETEDDFVLHPINVSRCFRMIKQFSSENRGRYYAYWRPKESCNIKQVVYRLQKKNVLVVNTKRAQIEPWQSALVILSNSEPTAVDNRLPDLGASGDLSLEIVKKTLAGNSDPGLKKFLSVAYLLGRSYGMNSISYKNYSEYSEATLLGFKRKISIFYFVAEGVDFHKAISDRLSDDQLDLFYYSGHSFFGAASKKLYELKLSRNIKEVVISSCTAFYYFDFIRNWSNAAKLYLTRNEGIDKNGQMLLNFFESRKFPIQLEFYDIESRFVRPLDFVSI
jgi:hypothetical protein